MLQKCYLLLRLVKTTTNCVTSVTDLVHYLTTLPIVNLLDTRSQELIKSKSDPKAGDGWEYYVDGIRLERVKSGWHGLAERIPARENVFNNVYKLFSMSSLWRSPIVGQVLGQSKLVPFRSEIVLSPLSTPFSYQATGV